MVEFTENILNLRSVWMLGGALGASFFFFYVWPWRSQQHRLREVQEIMRQKEFALLEQTVRTQRLPEVEAALAQAQERILDLSTRYAALEQALHQERLQGSQHHKNWEEMQKHLTHTFKALSYDALQENTKHFLEATQTRFSQWQDAAVQQFQSKNEALFELIRPLKEGLTVFDTKIADLEKSRQSAYDVLRHQVQELIHTQKDLKQETHRLVSALKTPTTRGRWGEIQLRRVVEMAGMVSHCDFLEQPVHSGEEAGILRPDLIVQLPGRKRVVVDAKTPLASYLEALESVDEGVRQDHLKQHARHVRMHIQNLSARQYWSQFSPTPEFVILFLPGEALFSAALEHDPSLIEIGVEHRVILATPTTLIALLRAVAYGWQQEHLAQNIEVVGKLGKDLYKRLQDMGKYITRMGRQLEGAVEAYNQLVGNMEHRVLVTARRFQEIEHVSSLGVLDPVTTLEAKPKTVQAPEWRSEDPELPPALAVGE